MGYQGEDKRSCPIGVFDSGMGGISVLRELVRIMPEEDYLYFGDSANAPYGTKPLEVIRDLTIQHINHLMDRGVKGVVVACNTATSAAVARLRQMYPDFPVVGIEPAIKPASLENPDKRIVVMATPMTLKQEKFQKLMKKYETQAQIIALPCPGLMEFVERGELEGEHLRTYLTKLLAPVQQEEIGGIVLGCTHYPFVKEMIQEVAGREVPIYDGGPGTAREMKRRLEQKHLLKSDSRDVEICSDGEKPLSEARKRGHVEFMNSRDRAEEIELCRKLLERKTEMT